MVKLTRPGAFAVRSNFTVAVVDAKGLKNFNSSIDSPLWEWNEPSLTAFDVVVAEAGARNLRLMIPLAVNNLAWNNDNK